MTPTENPHPGVPRPAPRRWPGLLLGAALIALLATPAAAQGNEDPGDPPVTAAVTDPLYDDLAALSARGDLELIGLLSKPLSRPALARRVAALPAAPADPTLTRLRRALAPEIAELERRTPQSTLIELRDRETRFTVGGFARFQAEASPAGGFVRTDSTRFGLTFGLTFEPGLTFYQELYVADIEGARVFADPLFDGTDVILFQDRVYVALDTRYARLALGRDRLAWGPGHHGSLLIARTARSFTQLRLWRSFLDGRFHATVVNGVLSGAERRYLALHRLDWRLHPRLRLGIAEGARYQADGFEPLYLVGVIPYPIVGRLLERANDDRASDALVRNNVLWAFDATWRPRDATEVYGELLIDDFGTAASQVPTRLAYQLGALAVTRSGGREIRWRCEWTRVWRHVYSTFYGAHHQHEGRPLGFPLGPDSRHLALEVDWLVDADWSLGTRLERQDRGEGRIGDFWDPDDPAQRGVRARDFLGVVERQWRVVGKTTYSPSRQLETLLEVGVGRAVNAAHQQGRRVTGLVGRVVVELRR